MGLTRDIAATYRSPRAAMRRQMAMGHREDRALMYLVLSCVLIFVAQWPRLQREAHLDDTVPFDARLGGALMAWVFIAPLALYGLAALSRMAARALGGRGSWYTARLALFWALLAATPLWLLNGLVAGLIGPGAQLTVTGIAALAAFVVFWGIGLHETEFGVVNA